MESPIKIPGEIPIIVLSQAVLFPHALLPLHIFEERYREMLHACLRGSRIFGVAQRLEWDDPSLPVPDLAEVMGVGLVRACVRESSGSSALVLQGLARVKIVGETQTEPFRIVKVRALPTKIGSAKRVHELAQNLRQQSRSLGQHGYEIPAKLDQFVENVNDPETLGDLLAAAFTENPLIRQEILETVKLETRLEIILAAMRLLETY